MNVVHVQMNAHLLQASITRTTTNLDDDDKIVIGGGSSSAARVRSNGGCIQWDDWGE